MRFRLFPVGLVGTVHVLFPKERPTHRNKNILNFEALPVHTGVREAPCTGSVPITSLWIPFYRA